MTGAVEPSTRAPSCSTPTTATVASLPMNSASTPPPDGVPAGELATPVVNHAGLIEDPEKGLDITAVSRRPRPPGPDRGECPHGLLPLRVTGRTVPLDQEAKRSADTSGARRPVPVSDHPGAQPVGPTASSSGLRGGSAALAARRGDRPSSLGSGHRRRPEAATPPRRLTVHSRPHRSQRRPKPGRDEPERPSRNPPRAEAWAAPLVSSTNSIARCRDKPGCQLGRARGDERSTRPLDLVALRCFCRGGWSSTGSGPDRTLLAGPADQDNERVFTAVP